MSRTATQLTAVGRLIENMARRHDEAEDHYLTERAKILRSAYPTSTVGDGTPRGTSSDTSIVESRIIELDQLDKHWHDIEAGNHLILVTAADQLQSYNMIFGMRAASNPGQAEAELDQCVGTIPNANNEPIRCPNIASRHTNATTGDEIDNLCDDHWMAACPICRKRPAETRRKVVIDGREVPGCEACARRQARHGDAA